MRIIDACIQRGKRADYYRGIAHHWDIAILYACIQHGTKNVFFVPIIKKNSGVCTERYTCCGVRMKKKIVVYIGNKNSGLRINALWCVDCYWNNEYYYWDNEYYYWDNDCSKSSICMCVRM